MNKKKKYLQLENTNIDNINRLLNDLSDVIDKDSEIYLYALDFFPNYREIKDYYENNNPFSFKIIYINMYENFMNSNDSNIINNYKYYLENKLGDLDDPKLKKIQEPNINYYYLDGVIIYSEELKNQEVTSLSFYNEGENFSCEKILIDRSGNIYNKIIFDQNLENKEIQRLYLDSKLNTYLTYDEINMYILFDNDSTNFFSSENKLKDYWLQKIENNEDIVKLKVPLKNKIKSIFKR